MKWPAEGRLSLGTSGTGSGRAEQARDERNRLGTSGTGSGRAEPVAPSLSRGTRLKLIVVRQGKPGKGGRDAMKQS